MYGHSDDAFVLTRSNCNDQQKFGHRLRDFSIPQHYDCGFASPTPIDSRTNIARIWQIIGQLMKQTFKTPSEYSKILADTPKSFRGHQRARWFTVGDPWPVGS
jgi:hypothetical protein